MRAQMVVPTVQLERGAVASLPRQVEQQIAEAIRKGVLPAGARLPSSRVMARLLGVSRNTAVAAYEALVDRGLVRSVAGSGVMVLGAARLAGPGLMNVRRALREAHYPARVQGFADPDGTGLYFSQQ